MPCNIWVFDAEIEKENVSSGDNKYSSSGINKTQLLLSQLPIYAPNLQTSGNTVSTLLKLKSFIADFSYWNKPENQDKDALGKIEHLSYIY